MKTGLFVDEIDVEFGDISGTTDCLAKTMFHGMYYECLEQDVVLAFSHQIGATNIYLDVSNT